MSQPGLLVQLPADGGRVGVISRALQGGAVAAAGSAGLCRLCGIRALLQGLESQGSGFSVAKGFCPGLLRIFLLPEKNG